MTIIYNKKDQKCKSKNKYKEKFNEKIFNQFFQVKKDIRSFE